MRSILIAVSAWCGLFGPAAVAQEEKREPAQVLAPFVNDATIAAVEIDAKNVDFDAIFSHLAKPKLFTTQAAELAEQKNAAKQLRDRFLRAGGRHIYFVFSLSENVLAVPQPLILIPAETAQAREAFTEFLKGPGALEVETRGGLIVAGVKERLESLRRLQAKEVPQLAPAFAAVSAFPQRAVLLLPGTLRRAVEELMPRLPDMLGGGPSAPLTRGLQWLAVGLDLSEKFQGQVLAQAENAADAAKLDEIGRRALELSLKEARLPAELAQVLRTKREGNRLELKIEGKAIDEALLTMTGRIREAASVRQSINNLKHIALAMHGYHDLHKSFPAQASYDKQKKPLLSWRVHILPLLDEAALYEQFKLDEPWDSAHNKKLLAKMPSVYRSPLASDLVEKGKTTYLVPVGPKLVFGGPKGTKIQQITDGTSNTILAVDADEAHAVYWTQPEDLRVDPKQPKAGVVHQGLGMLAAFCDGSVRVLQATIANEVFWSLLTPSGGEALKDF